MLLLLAVASVVIAVVTTVTLRQFLDGRLDNDLRATSGLFQRFAGPPPFPPPDAGGLPESGNRGPRPPDSLLAQIDGGRVVSATVYTRDGETRPVPPEEYPDLTGLPVDGRPQSEVLGDLGSYRLLATDTATRGVVVAGLSERNVEDTMSRLRTTEIVVALGTLLLAGLAGAFVVRRELRPLERVAVTAARVSTLPLDRGEVSLAERVPDVDPNTEVGQVGSALNRMLEHVGSALAARQDSETRLRQFVADASHELRTPLAAIRGYAELSRRGELSADTEYSLTRISSQAERMTTLVEDLLLLARLDAGRPLERAEVDLTRLVVDAVSDAHVSGPEHRWQLALPEEPVTVPGDPARLTQVLANLLANARTHTPPGSTVTVGLTANHQGAELSVLDNGPGIAAELLPHVFERFARGSSSRARPDGSTGSTGLGLSIVQAVVAAHGGTVRVASAPGRTSFTVWLPAGGTATDLPPPVPAAPAPRH
jgi:two-component system, OmpR family, sensor kinase